MSTRRLYTLIEQDTERCQNVHGIDPCTAGRVHSGQMVAADQTTATLGSGSSLVTDAYVNHDISINSQRRRIINSVAVAINRLLRSEELVTAPWSLFGTGNQTDNTDTAPDGTMTADTFSDTSSLNAFGSRQSVLISATEPQCFSMYVKKDSVPAGTREVGLSIKYDFSGKIAFVSIDTSIGSVRLTTTSPSIVLGHGVIDHGTYWRFWLSMKTDDVNDTYAECSFYTACAPGTLSASGFAAGGGAMTVNLDTLASSVDGAYEDQRVRVFNPAGQWQDRLVASYVGATKLVTVDLRFLTNYLKFSESLGSADWVVLDPFSDGFALDSESAPNATMTADKFEELSSVYAEHSFSQVTGKSAQNTRYTISVYAKMDERSDFRVYIENNSDLNDYGYANFGVEYGDIGVSGVAGTASNAVASMNYEGDGWYRCTLSVNPSTSAGNVRVRIMMLDSLDGPDQYTSGFSLEGMYFWGLQMIEAYLDLAPEYVLTTTDPWEFPAVNTQYEVWDDIGIARTGSAVLWGAQLDNTATPQPYTKTQATTLTNAKVTVSPRWATNLFEHSNGIDNAAWTKTNASVDPDTYVAGNGTTADKLVEDTSNTTHLVRNSTAMLASLPYVASVKAKAAGRSLFTMILLSNAVNYRSAHFDLNAGTVTVGNTALAGSQEIQSLGNGEYLCILKATTTATPASSYVDYRMSDGSPGGAGDIYLGDGSSGIYFWNNQFEQATEIGDYIETTTAPITLPDATTQYDIIDQSTACYNTIRTCADRPNYVKGVHTYEFVDVGSPLQIGVNAYPYIGKISVAPTEIDIEKGLARRGMTTVTLIGDADSDVELDPYFSYRSTPKMGLFWNRFLARISNYVDRPVRVKRATEVDGVLGAFDTELYLVDSIKGPAPDGSVSLVLKDPISLAGRVKVPTPSNGKLSVELTLNDLSLTLASGFQDEYTRSGYVRVKTEIIRYVDTHVPDGWNFSNTSEGWVAVNATITPSAYEVTVTVTGSAPTIEKGGLSFAGGSNRYVAIRMRRTNGSTWSGKLRYSTLNGHGYLDSYSKTIAAPVDLVTDGDYITAIWDMFQLDAGGLDWINNTISGLQVFLGTTSGDEYIVDWIAYGPYDYDLVARQLVLETGSDRARFGSSAIAAGVGELVQQCLVYENVPVTGAIEDLLIRSGIDQSYVDTAGFAVEEQNWYGTQYYVTICLASPELISTYLAELAFSINSVIWWSPTEQFVKLKAIMPNAPNAATIASVTDEANIIENSVKIEQQDELRKTLVGMYYGLNNPSSNLSEAASYSRGEIYIDTVAEDEYGGRRSDVQFTRWFQSTNDVGVRAWCKRRLTQYRDVPFKVSLKVDPKDSALKEGDLVDLVHDQITDYRGAPKLVKVLVLRRQDNGETLDYVARSTNFARRYGFIAPAGTADYPNNNGYACICAADGRMSNDDEGYIII